MSVSLSREQLQCLARLGRTPDGEQFVQLLKFWQAAVDKTLRTASGEALVRAQGEAQRLEELVELIDGGAHRRLLSLSRPVRPVAESFL